MIRTRTLGEKVALGLSLCALAGCGQTPVAQGPVASPPVDLQALSNEVAKVLDDWHDAAAKADEARYFGHLSDDSIFLGTDATERWDKKAFLAYAHPHFAKGKAWKFRAARRAIVVAQSGEYAWFDEDLETERLGPARGSGVVAKRPEGLRILQYNLSIPIPNERFDAVKKVIAGDASP